MRVLRSVLFLFLAASTVHAAPLEFVQKEFRYSGSTDAEFEIRFGRLLKGVGETGAVPSDIKWEMATRSAWIRLDTKGAKIFGRTPSVPDKGVVRLRATQNSKFIEADIYINVAAQPEWKERFFDFGKLLVDKPFEYALADKVKNGEGRRLLFRADNLPAWLKLDAARGVLYGTPKVGDRGLFASVELTVATGAQDGTRALASGEVVVTGNTGKTPTPPAQSRTRLTSGAGPVWLEDPITLPSASTGRAYSYDLFKNARDVDNDTLTFKIIQSNAAWLSLSADGRLSGTPTVGGDHTLVVEVSDGTSQAQGGVFLRVTSGNQAPIIHQTALNFSAKEREVFQKELHDPQFVTDDNANLTFKLNPPVQWATISSTGKLSVTAKYPNVGDKLLGLEVSDGTNTTSGKIRMRITADPQKPVWREDPIRRPAAAGTQFNESVAGLAFDRDGRPLTFSKASGAAWLDVTSQGVVFGMPPSSAGDHTVVVRAANEAMTTDVAVVLTVKIGNQAPAWVGQSVTLPNAKVGQRYSADVTGFVRDPESQALKFTKVAGPNWLAVSADGIVGGTPRAGDVGPSGIRLRATDPQGAFADATAEVMVDKPNSPPRWTQDEPIALPELAVGKAMNYDLKAIVKDDEGDALTFAKVTGPGWLQIDPAGKATGTPGAGDVQSYIAIISVSDGGTPRQAGFAGKVVPPNHAPVITQPLKFPVAERKVFTLNLNQVDFVTDPDGDTMIFSLAPVGWASLSKEGLLTLRPTYDQIGTQVLKFDVTDGKDVASGEIEVTVTRDPRPPVWKADPIRITATAGVPFSGTLKDKAQDRDGLPVSFSKQPTGPAWLNVDASGRLTGTPGDEDAGENTFIVSVKNDKLGADAALIIDVSSDNSRPVWRQPVVLPAGKAGKTYAQSLKNFATDPDPDDELTFEKVAGPNWAFVTSSGLVIGQPEEADAVVNVLTARVRDLRRAYADTQVQIPIESKNNKPRWVQIPIQLGNAKVGVRFSFDLTHLVEDADNDPITFRKAEGPAWLLVGTDGNVSGTPGQSDTDFTAVFEASDGKSVVQVEAMGRVLGGNKKPILHPEALDFGVAVNQVFTVELNQKKFVEDPEGDALTFRLLSSMPWVSLTPAGALRLAPTPSHKGNHQIALRVTDSDGGSIDGIIKVRVDVENRPPIWILDPIELSATPDQMFQADLKSWARDLAGLPLTYSITNGPNWLAVNSTSGIVSGRPTGQMAGQVHNFTVVADNGTGRTEAHLLISINSTLLTDSYNFQSPEKNAPIDLLFVLDNTASTAAYYEELKRASSEFFQRLDEATVRYSVVMLSSRSFLGQPFRAPNGEKRLTSQNNYVASDFRQMIDATRSSEYYQSAVWAMDRFLIDIRSQSGLYQDEYFYPQVPLIAFAHSFSRDRFDVLMQGTQGQGATPSDVGRGLTNYLASFQKPFQLYVNDMSCNATANQMFKDMVSPNYGRAVSWNPCSPPGTWMRDFADVVIAQAARYAKTRFSLTRKPDLAKMKVALQNADGRVALKGNTGDKKDQWHYDSQRNEVVLHWWNIRAPFDAQNDRLKIEY